jgi:hypothetical protein
MPPQAKARPMVKAKAKAKAAAKAKAHAKAKAKAKARPARTKNWTNHALEAIFSFVFYSSCLVKHVTASSYVLNVPVEVEFSQIWQILGIAGSSVETLIRCELLRRLIHEKELIFL